MSLQSEKTALRARLLSHRKAASADERAERDERLCEILLSSPLVKEASCVYLYAAVRGEIDLSPLANALSRLGVPLAYPITERGGVMHFRLATPAELVAGGYGIPEPRKNAPEPPLNERSVCLVPALAYDESGSRIGYGGGYYDRFLRGFPGISIGIADRPAPDLLPREAHDEGVDYLLTLRGIQKIPSQRKETK